ncbi:MAG: DEAD/DEAH box helicase family protein, partial [Anaerolineales bacterium]|nr:DEAD/DEAH box helicase family protein [Anaerolineales bacterium]
MSETIAYVEVAVNVPAVTEVFHYHLPEALAARVRPGHLVEVPFGKQQVQGVVLRAVAQPGVAETKPVSGLVDEEAALTASQLLLAERQASQSLIPLAAWIRLMLPPGLGQQADTLYERQEPAASRLAYEAGLGEAQRRLLDLLARRGPLRGRQIEAALRHVDWRGAARALTRKGALARRAVLPEPGVSRQQVRTARLALPWEQVEAVLPQVGRAGSPAQARRQAMLRFLADEQKEVDVAWVYAASRGSASDLRRLAELGLVVIGKEETWRDPLEGKAAPLSEAPTLTHDQQACWEAIQGRIQAAAAGEAARPILLHGVTGSGKTELYLQAVAETLALGRQAIVLVPEISLTPQTVNRFLARFPGQVGLAHSKLS